MIPKASQRAGGQDLGTHLLNAHDNEYAEVAEVRGAIAQDLHGAFAEWEVQAHALTKCRNYLYSLSLNPDPAQGELTRAQYADFIERAEKRLGLEGQPRAIVFHIKEGREHCHVVWSRIDATNEKAIHQAFDRETLMIVARQFARDHGLMLPDGMADGREEKGPQLSLYEKSQERATGLSKDERIAQVTQAWRSADSPKAFVNALSQMGYILATGNRPYVLVDIYGCMNALPKLIDDKSVRTKTIRAFLERDFPVESLPSIEDAKKLAALHRKAREDFAKTQVDEDQRDALKRFQEARMEKLEAERTALSEEHGRARKDLAAQHLAERRALKSAHLAETARLRARRAEAKPTGLAAFLGRVTGMSLVIRKLQRHRDRRRYDVYRDQRDALTVRQKGEAAGLQRHHELRMADVARRIRAQKQVDARERKSLETALLKELRIEQRRGRAQMPAVNLTLTPQGRKDVPHKAKNRHTSTFGEAFEAEASATSQWRTPDLTEEFTRVAGGESSGGGDDEGSGDAVRPKERSERLNVRGPRPRRRGRGR